MLESIYFKLQYYLTYLGRLPVLGSIAIKLYSILRKVADGFISRQLNFTKQKLDRLSATMCAAKWTQATWHLHNGHVHSCHHPIPHLVDSTQLNNGPNRLHNTHRLIEARTQMQNGQWPAECDYCSKVERDATATSDRHYKSSQSWSKHFFDNKIYQQTDNVSPSHLEISFSSKCQLRCLYCSPSISSALYHEVKRHGAFKTSDNHHTLEVLKKLGQISIEEESNPYVIAFWNWWPKLKKSLNVLRLTGGEPLLSDSTFKLLNVLHLSPCPWLELSINSNLDIPRQTVDKFNFEVKRLLKKNHIKQFKLFASLDGWGDQAVYQRFGLNLKNFKNNIDHILKTLPPIQFTILCTYNLLSLWSFNELCNFVIELRRKYFPLGHHISLGVSYLREPKFLSLPILPSHYVEQINGHLEHVQTLSKNFPRHSFSTSEIGHIERLKQVISLKPRQSELTRLRNDFFIFINEIDKRHETNFCEIFPEYQEFFQQLEVLGHSSSSKLEAISSMTPS